MQVICMCGHHLYSHSWHYDPIKALDPERWMFTENFVIWDGCIEADCTCDKLIMAAPTRQSEAGTKVADATELDWKGPIC